MVFAQVRDLKQWTPDSTVENLREQRILQLGAPGNCTEAVATGNAPERLHP
jgi:hypothetical protein